MEGSPSPLKLPQEEKAALFVYIGPRFKNTNAVFDYQRGATRLLVVVVVVCVGSSPAIASGPFLHTCLAPDSC